MNYVIELDRVTVRYQDLVALEEISFRVARGEFVALIGPNGSGKTTLVKTILGLVTPAAGTVRLFGQPPQQLDGGWKRVGYVPQVAQVDPRFPIRVLDVVLMGRYGRLGLIRRPGLCDREAARRALEQVGMADLAERPIGRLSGGQRQRVLVARAFCWTSRPPAWTWALPKGCLICWRRSTTRALPSWLSPTTWAWWPST